MADEDVEQDAPGARAATIYDVAAEAGVSPSTVSRAFSRPGRVSAATSARIFEVAARLGYRAEGVTRPALPARTHIAGLVVSDITNPFFFGIIRGAERAARHRGFTLALIDTQESGDLERSAFERTLPLLDALVMGSSRVSDTDLRRLGRVVPTVVLNRHVGGLPCVTPDHGAGVRKALELLSGQGHRRIAYVAGPEASWADGARWRASREAGRDLQLSVVRLGPNVPTLGGGRQAVQAVIERGVTAVLAFNDLVAVGLMQGLAAAGVEVPGEVSVIGFDNSLAADLVVPGLTTVAAPLAQLGETAMDAALRMATSRHDVGTPSSIVPVRLVERASTGPCPA